MTDHFLLFSAVVISISCIIISTILLLQIRKMVGHSTSTYKELKKVVYSTSIVRGAERERELYKMRVFVLREIGDLIAERVEIIKREEHPSLVSTQLRNKTFNEILYLVSKRIDELREERPD